MLSSTLNTQHLLHCLTTSPPPLGPVLPLVAVHKPIRDTASAHLLQAFASGFRPKAQVFTDWHSGMGSSVLPTGHQHVMYCLQSVDHDCRLSGHLQAEHITEAILKLKRRDRAIIKWKSLANARPGLTIQVLMYCACLHEYMHLCVLLLTSGPHIHWTNALPLSSIPV